MPYEHDLIKAKDQAYIDALSIAYATSNTDLLTQMISDAIVKAYVAGYKQAEENAKIGA